MKPANKTDYSSSLWDPSDDLTQTYWLCRQGWAESTDAWEGENLCLEMSGGASGTGGGWMNPHMACCSEGEVKQRFRINRSNPFTSVFSQRCKDRIQLCYFFPSLNNLWWNILLERTSWINWRQKHFLRPLEDVYCFESRQTLMADALSSLVVEFP